MPLAAPDRDVILVKNILSGLMALYHHLRLYREENAVVTLSGSRLALQLERYFATEPTLEIVVARHGFLYRGVFVDRSNANFEKFAHLLFTHGIAAVRFQAGIPIAGVHGFLHLLRRKPTETWEEGGFAAALEARRIGGVEVVELTDRFIQLEDGEENAPPEVGGGSDLWDRFALSLVQTTGAEDAEEVDLTPGELAARTNSALAAAPEETRAKAMRDVGEFLVFLQHENIPLYRSKALERLALYVESLSPELKTLFLRNVFNLSLSKEMAESFFTSLSDDLIIEALRTAARKENYVPPVVLSLLGKLAREREGCAGAMELFPEEFSAAQQQTLKHLFRQDEFEKYVPETYRRALLEIVRSDGLHTGLSPALTELKTTLENDEVEAQIGRIVYEIIRSQPDELHFAGVRRELEQIIRHHLEGGDFNALRQLHGVCAQAAAQGEAGYAQLLTEVFGGEEFIAAILRAPRNFGRERFDDLKRLIATVGRPFLTPLLDALAEESNRGIRFFYLDSIKTLAADPAAEVTPRLTDPRWYVVRNMLYLLRELNDPAALPWARNLLRHEHPRVVHEAVTTCIHFSDPAGERHLLQLLAATDPALSQEGATLARLCRSERVVDALLLLLQRGTLFNYYFELKRAAIQSLGEIGHPKAVPVLDALLAEHAVFHRSQHEQLKIEAVRSLRLYPPPLVAEIVNRLAGSSDAPLARVAREVRQRLKEGRA